MTAVVEDYFQRCGHMNCSRCYRTLNTFSNSYHQKRRRGEKQHFIAAIYQDFRRERNWHFAWTVSQRTTTVHSNICVRIQAWSIYFHLYSILLPKKIFATKIMSLYIIFVFLPQKSRIKEKENPSISCPKESSS